MLMDKFQLFNPLMIPILALLIPIVAILAHYLGKAHSERQRHGGRSSTVGIARRASR